jgi:hypothetical protein
MPEGFRGRLADLRLRASGDNCHPRERGRRSRSRDRDAWTMESRGRDRDRDRERRGRDRSRDRERRRSRSRSGSLEQGRARRRSRSRSPRGQEHSARGGGSGSGSAVGDLRAQAPGGGGGAARMLSAAVSAAQGDSGEWYYMDAQGVEQGPFGLQQMRQWYAAGYFTSELQAKCGRRGELRPFATISEIAVADELTLRPELAAAGDWSMGHAAGSGAAAAAAAMPSVEQSSAQIAAMQQESLAAAVQQPGAGKDEGRSASGRHPTFGSAPWRAEQERRDVFQQHQAVVLQQVRSYAVANPQLVVHVRLI